MLFTSILSLFCNYIKVYARPNVLLITIDDCGWIDIGCENINWFQTPRINKLRKHSLEFINVYA